MLCDIIGMIYFIDRAGGKADLISVGGIAGRRAVGDLRLGKLARKGIRYGCTGIGTAGDAHCLINIGASGQRVAYCSAKAGSRSAEGFDLGRMVMRLVLEHQQPVLRPAVHIDLDLDRAGVDLLRFVKILEHSGLFQIFRGDGSHIHQRDILVPRAVYKLALFKIIVKGFLNIIVADPYLVDCGEEGRMAAVIRPIGIDQTNLGNGGIALFLIFEIALTELYVVKIHRQRIFFKECAQLILAHADEALDRLHRGRNIELFGQSLGLAQRSLAALDRVDDIMLDSVKLGVGQIAGKNVYAGGTHCRSVLIGYQLYALCAGIGALVELSGEILNGENLVAVIDRQLVINDIALRLGKNRILCLSKDFARDAFDIIAVEHPQTGQRGDHQILAYVRKE